jgi:phage protein D
MAKQVKNSDLVQGKLWEPTIKETESLITVLDKLEQSFKDVSKASSQAAKKADPGSAKGISTINEELEKQKRIKSELSKVDKQREAAESRLRVAQSKQGQDLERTNQRLLRQRQANRALAKETDTLNSAYGRSSARLTRLTKKYKDLEFQNKGNTKEAK